jgi:hypothetical protein
MPVFWRSELERQIQIVNESGRPVDGPEKRDIAMVQSCSVKRRQGHVVCERLNARHHRQISLGPEFSPPDKGIFHCPVSCVFCAIQSRMSLTVYLTRLPTRTNFGPLRRATASSRNRRDMPNRCSTSSRLNNRSVFSCDVIALPR